MLLDFALVGNWLEYCLLVRMWMDCLLVWMLLKLLVMLLLDFAWDYLMLVELYLNWLLVLRWLAILMEKMLLVFQMAQMWLD